MVNLNDNEIEAEIQISPDDIHYYTDIRSEVICPFGMEVFVPQRFLQFVRVVITVRELCESAKLKVYMQAQY
ncbi:hypothetical protein KS419_14355 [Bacillus tamaricis]|uniref:DUF6385 domain-containing protein n=1 Tax=Evansella tamaricis TaxID=2069301 RepID=A0ABS6JGV6_9BACI|nr:hypothetical protein [Evansella tamaricis]